MISGCFCFKCPSQLRIGTCALESIQLRVYSFSVSTEEADLVEIFDISILAHAISGSISSMQGFVSWGFGAFSGCHHQCSCRIICCDVGLTSLIVAEGFLCKFNVYATVFCRLARGSPGIGVFGGVFFELGNFGTTISGRGSGMLD